MIHRLAATFAFTRWDYMSGWGTPVLTRRKDIDSDRTAQIK